MVALNDSTPQPVEGTPAEGREARGAVSSVTRRTHRGAATTAARTALARAILGARPPRARRKAWSLARRFFLAMLGAGEAGMLAETAVRPELGDKEADEFVQLAGRMMDRAAWVLCGHPREGSIALALVQVLAGESATTIGEGWGSADARWYVRQARSSLAILSALEPPR